MELREREERGTHHVETCDALLLRESSLEGHGDGVVVGDDDLASRVVEEGLQ
jgi:hypothetical protein